MIDWKWYLPRFYRHIIHNEEHYSWNDDGFRGYTFGITCGRYTIHIELLRDVP